MKRILVLGCTGSIGTSTLSIIREMPESFCVCGLVAHTSRESMTALSREFNCPGALTAEDPECIGRLLNETKPDIVVNGISGSDGLLPSKTVLEAGVDMALANKETVVMAWPLVKKLAEKKNARILPVDSEHSALFNLIGRMGKDCISELVITASGGPFREYSRDQLSRVTAAQALNHPTWKMGKKITIDSATLANKGLEVIEACRLFDFNPGSVQVVVHPQSIVHSLVRTKDGMLYAQLSDPDMKHPILSALTWPENVPNCLSPFDLFDRQLTFYRPRTEDFPLLAFAYEAAEKGGSYTIAYNAANEESVAFFLQGKLSFPGLSEVTARVLESDWSADPDSFEAVIETDGRAREMARSILAGHTGK
jgi:1-deoxy-D-xylulose 5-phosphate reductoisomerase